MSETPPAERALHPVAKPPAVMASVPWESPLADALRVEFGGSLQEASTYLGQPFVVVELSVVVPVLSYLKGQQDFALIVDLTAVDYPPRDRRFEVVYTLYSFTRNERLRVKVNVAEGDAPRSAVPVFAGANWLEREVFDMFGIRFAGHPNLRRMLLPEEWQGHPLRKDYGILQMDQDWVRENLHIESGQ